MKLKIISPQRQIWEGEIEQVTVPSSEGEITILPHHVPLLTPLQEGIVHIVQKDREEFFAIYGGFLEVNRHEVIILTSEAQSAEEIKSNAIQAAQELMEEQKKHPPQKGKFKFLPYRPFIESQILAKMQKRRRHHPQRGKI